MYGQTEFIRPSQSLSPIINFDLYCKHNLNWSQIFDHPYRILIMWGSRTNALLNLIKAYQRDVYLYANDV